MANISQEQLIALLNLLGNSKLISELGEITSITTNNNYLVLNSGSDDAQKSKIPLLRGSLGTYDVVTNTPNISNATGLSGDTYTSSNSGSRDFGNGVVNLITDDVIFYNGSKWIKLTLTQISDIYNLQAALDEKVSLDSDNEFTGENDFLGNVSALTFEGDGSQLTNVSGSVNEDTVGDEFFVDDDGIIRSNLSGYRQNIYYTGGSQVFVFDFEPTFISGIFINGIYIDENDYIYTSPNQLEILGLMEIGDKLKIMYEHFIIEPTL